MLHSLLYQVKEKECVWVRFCCISGKYKCEPIKSGAFASCTTPLPTAPSLHNTNAFIAVTTEEEKENTLRKKICFKKFVLKNSF